MFIFETYNIFVRIFYLYGLAPVTLITLETNPESLSHVVPAAITSIISICITFYLLYVPHLPYGAIGIIINYLTLLFSVLMTFTATGQCVFYKRIYHKMIQRTQRINNSFTEKCSTKLPLRSFSFRYRLKALLVFGSFFVSQGLVIVEVWLVHPSRSLWLPIVNAALRSVYPVAVLHFILYVESVVVIIQELNRQIQSLGIVLHSESKFTFLGDVKSLHMDVWKLVVEINKFFGWSLLCLTIYSFIFVTKQLYFIFTVIHVQWNVLALVEGLVSLSYGVVCLSVLVSSCRSPSIEVTIIFRLMYKFMLMWTSSKNALIENIEQYVTIHTSDKTLLHQHILRQDLLGQIAHLCVDITASDFFIVDRKFLAGIIASCCMYIIIFIQFNLAAE